MDVDILRGFLLRDETEEIKIIAESCLDKLNSIKKEEKVDKDEIIRDLFVEGFIDDEMKKSMNKSDTQMVIAGK